MLVFFFSEEIHTVTTRRPQQGETFPQLQRPQLLFLPRSSSNYRSPSPVRQKNIICQKSNNTISDRNQAPKPTSPPPPHRPPLPSPWRLEAAAYPPPGLRAGRRREGGGEEKMRQDGEELTDGEVGQWRFEAGGYPPPGLRAGRGREGGGDFGEERLRQDGDGEEDYRSLYQRERQEREVSGLTSRGTKMSSQLNSFAHSLFSSSGSTKSSAFLSTLSMHQLPRKHILGGEAKRK